MAEYEEWDIDKVDEVLRLGSPTTKIPAYFVWFVTIAIWAVGIYAIYKAVLGELALLAIVFTSLAQVLSQVFNIVVIFSLLVLLVAIVGSYLLLYLIKVAARIVLLLILFVMPISIISLGVLLAALGAIMYAAILWIVGGMFLLFVIYKRARISLAGRAMQLSAQAILDEKGTLLAMFLAGIFGLFTFITLSFASMYVGDLVYSMTDNSDYGMYAAFIVFFLGSWSIGFFNYLMNATVARIIHDWYRSPKKDVASFSKGLKKALKVQGGIALYALLMVTFRFIVEYLRGRRREKSLVAVVAAAVAEVAESIIRLITIYAIPAMVIRETGFKSGIKDSFSKLKDLFIETLAGSYGFGYVLAIFGFIIMIFYGAVGYILGVYVIYPFIVNYIPSIVSSVVGLISGLGFIFIGLIPTIIIFNALGIAFITILYEFGLDIEFRKKGIMLPYRLPEDIRMEFEKVLASRGIV